MTLPLPLQSFGQEHFATARLGDHRRTRCLVELADRFARHPKGSLPEKAQDPNPLRRCYDLMNNPAVTHHHVLEPHRRRTLDLLVQQRGVVRIVHDPTELDSSGPSSLAGQLGPIGEGHGSGYLCHNSLAVLPGSKAVLGLVNQILHRRDRVPPDETPAQCAARQSRESLLWLHAVRAIDQAVAQACRLREHPGLPAGLVVVDVADRASDTFEFLDEEDRLSRKYVVRSKANRRIRVGHDGHGAETLLHTHLRTLAAQGPAQQVTVGGRDGQPSRTARVRVAFAAVTVLPPQGHAGRYRPQPQRVWALRVWESAAPAGVEPVAWFLLTNLEVAQPSEAWEKVEWYCCRWLVEEFHKAQKSGCDIESPQFTAVARREPMLALLRVVAVGLLSLRDLSRDARLRELPATVVADEESVAVLSGWRFGERRRLRVWEFFQALGGLGGHQNRKCDGAPGWLVRWRGWMSLQQMVAGARASRCPPAAADGAPSGEAMPAPSPESGP